MTNSRAKGARGELELAKKLESWEFPAHRTQQFCGHNGDSDVQIKGIDLFIEVKRYKDGIKLHTSQFEGWVTTCWQQCAGKPWMLFTRNDREPWYLTYMPKGAAFHHTVTGEARIKQVINAVVHEIELAAI